MKNLLTGFLILQIILFYCNAYPQDNKFKIEGQSLGITQSISGESNLFISHRIGSPILGSSGNKLIKIRSGINHFKTNQLIPTMLLGVESLKSSLLSEFRLYQNYPNPFNPKTKIRYAIAEFSFVSLKIFDILGNEIMTLVNKENPAGIYVVDFDGKDLSSGFYFYRLHTPNYAETKRMLLIK